VSVSATKAPGRTAESVPQGTSPVTEDVIIRIENIHKSYLMGKEAVPALRGVSLAIQRGDMVCLMGPSGSGKTTLLNIVGGLDEPGRGHVAIDGADVVSMGEEKLARLRLEKIGFVFQTFNLLNNFTALENVEAPMVLLGGRSKRERRERATELLAAVGLGDRAEHFPSELSGGQQQRVAIARALANDPAIVIGDEMTGDLDSKTGFEVMEVVRDLNQRQGKTIVYVTHDPRMAAYADYTVHLLDGVIVARDEDPQATLARVEEGHVAPR
jgi:ABC-type lipoprotein export system ATPase subunit